MSFLAKIHYNHYKKGLLKVEDISNPRIRREVEELIAQEGTI